MRWARDAGFAALSADLIYGLPGQTLAQWRRTLEKVLAFQPEHLSCYQLTCEPGTELGRPRAAGDFTLPVEEKEREIFFFTSRFLEDKGYLHYEVSNFARGEALISRHNSKYWRHTPYLGLGPAAHSFNEGRRWWNCRSVAEYGEKLHRGQVPVAGADTTASPYAAATRSLPITCNAVASRPGRTRRSRCSDGWW